MYFPNDMNFQYFFFDTYPGYFLQALPVALLAGIIYVIFKTRKGNSLSKTLIPSLFVCYVTGLLCLTLFIFILGDIYYFLFYHAPSGRTYNWFTFEFDFIPDFHLAFGSENVGNILMFFPFGVLYPLFNRNSTWLRTLFMGFAVSIGIELLQPILGRSFDINDIILNGTGIVISTVFFFLMKKIISHIRQGIKAK